MTRRIDPTEPNRVPPEGPLDARIMLIGEAPGETEVKKRKPFCGLSGNVLNDILAEVGIARSRCYITNVVKYRPRGNKFSNFYEKKKGKWAPTQLLLEGVEELKREIAQVNPNVIVPLGNEALKVLTGHRNITDWRGSIISTSYGKVIPSIHPASILRNWAYRPAAVSDFARVLEESSSPSMPNTHRELVICYNSEEAINELQKIKEEGKPVAFDIETESDQVTCISMANRRDRSVSIPFWFGSSGSLHAKENEERIWGLIDDVLSCESIPKIAHNGAYDIGFLRRVMGIQVRGFTFDTMVAMHALYLELPKSLAFATSIYTDQPYYKFMGKTDSMDVHFEYNAMDSCVTYEIYTKLKDELDDAGLSSFYRDYMHSLIMPLMDMEYRGVRFDVEAKNKLRRQYRNQLAMLQDKLERLVGHELNTASHPQMTKWLYTELKYPKITKLDKATGRRSLTANNDALNKCLAKKDNEAVRIVLQIRELSKVYSTYLGVKLDEDKRIRCSYNLTGTETGRLSSSTTARGTGTNLQNIPEGVIKSLFIPDEGKTFINGDLSQAEARVVAYLSNEERLISVFEQGGDIHRKNAANIFNTTEREVTNDQRQMAKRVVHASNYGMGPRTFASQTGVSESDARRLLNQYFATYPRIKVWHMQIQDTLRRARQLTTPFGRKRTFFSRWTDSLYKEGLAYIPQSTVADILNQALLCLYRKWLGRSDRELLLQVHDSILVQCDTRLVDEVVAEMRECMERPLEINGRILTIPSDFKVGSNWGNMRAKNSLA